MLRIISFRSRQLIKFSTPRTTSVRKCSNSESTTTKAWSFWKVTVSKFIPIGICLVAVMQWRVFRKNDQIAKSWEITCYCALPLRSISRMWGWIADKQLPENIRPFVYKLYADTFKVNLSEARYEDLKYYPSLADFFARPLKEGARLIDKQSCIVSPCDGTVLQFGKVKSESIEQVKGVTYSLQQFLGENTWNKNNKTNNVDYANSLLLHDKKNALYQCIIYLAPGDYHRFHSPVEWKPTFRRHFTGQLLSVNPKIACWLPNLFCLNERAVYLGQWDYGFFSFTAVGATNVGTVKVYFDKSLQTNKPKTTYISKDKFLGSNIFLHKGDPVGEFRMGSTIVLIFEAPQDFNFSLSVGQCIKMGQRLGSLTKL